MRHLDLLNWVGEIYYTKEKFLEEAKKIGTCRRTAVIPADIQVGKSRIFFVQKGEVFAYSVIRGISYVVKSKVDIPEELKKRGVEAWEYVEKDEDENERDCGKLVINGTYFLSEKDMKKCRDLADSGTLKGQIVVIDPSVPYTGKRFRGFKYIFGDRVLKRKPTEEWFNGVEDIRKLNEKERSPKQTSRQTYDISREERFKYIKKRAEELKDLPLLERRRTIRKEVMEKFGLKRKTADWVVWQNVT